MARETLKLTSPNMRGSDVKAVQQMLTLFGYFSGSIDSIYGPATKSAVEQFQQGHSLSVDGIVGAKTWAALEKRPTLRMHDKSDYVKYAQNLLLQKGYQPGNADGIYGTKTQEAVKTAQQRNGIAVDGVMGPDTWAKLDVDTATKHPTLRKGDKGDDVVYLQQQLNAQGYDAGQEDGIFGTNTYNAVIRLQEAAGISTDGIVGAKTWAALEGGAPAPSPTEEPHTEHFKMSEFNTPDGTVVPQRYWGNLQQLMNQLEKLRTAIGGHPIAIRSGYRYPEYNEAHDGAKNSQHLYAAACDCYVPGYAVNTYEMGLQADKIFADGGCGFGDNYIIHVDVRGVHARWWYTYTSWSEWESNQDKR
ncbi:peptidoglycan-binding protein [Clostridia bacterium OttesenSCG-928-F22]|nr:peptidoglycan-binding protein [Clostridia bacterium OttesenSCG-928-F22]